MAFMKSKDNKHMSICCKCGCDDGIRFEITKDWGEDYCFMSYYKGNFYAEQNETFWSILRKKIKKIWAIIRSKDFYYSEIILSKDDFEEFRNYINSIE